MNTSLIILLHGVGSSGDDLLPLADAWKHQLPGCDFASPDAPTHSDFGQGYQWFSVVGVTEQNRPRRIQAARASFDTTLARLMAVRGLEGQPEKVVLAGFSQGATMALDAVASGRWPVAGVVAFSGRLATPLPLTPAAAQTPVLLLHGGQDDVIPASESPLAARLLSAVGMKATAKIFPGLGHTLSPEGITLAGRFIAQAVSRER
ncbi:Phospholipase/carboxylesterase [Sodalis praecaptivus]|uniref:Phospholipase/carboxylesterase n=1 Tax=Sodalis praecaptivus TaxID=1239307 RepID=W0HZG9_9GAMM|nr:dienelactone hydrolase family protein [Sodalis praecaptivus]AHF77548.1 Phospholipase/carboxylesterase [Sodalis praecaptivus]